MGTCKIQTDVIISLFQNIDYIEHVICVDFMFTEGANTILFLEKSIWVVLELLDIYKILFSHQMKRKQN